MAARAIEVALLLLLVLGALGAYGSPYDSRSTYCSKPYNYITLVKRCVRFNTPQKECNSSDLYIPLSEQAKQLLKTTIDKGAESPAYKALVENLKNESILSGTPSEIQDGIDDLKKNLDSACSTYDVCGPYPLPNGRVVYGFGDVKFYCNAGFYRTQVMVIDWCYGQTGIWGGTLNNQECAACRRPNDERIQRVDARGNIFCANNYVRISTGPATCVRSTGYWTFPGGSDPCVACRIPEGKNIAHIDITGKVICSTISRLSSQAQRASCNKVGMDMPPNWTLPFDDPCQVLHCPRLNDPAYGQLPPGGTVVGTIREFSCNSNATLIGTNKVKCERQKYGRQGRWSATPTCDRVCGTSNTTNITIFESGSLASEDVEELKQRCIRQGGMLPTAPFAKCTGSLAHRSQRDHYYVFRKIDNSYRVLCTKPKNIPKPSFQCKDKPIKAYFPTTGDGNYIFGEKASNNYAMVDMCPATDKAPTDIACAGDLMEANADLGTYYSPVFANKHSAPYGILVCFTWISPSSSVGCAGKNYSTYPGMGLEEARLQCTGIGARLPGWEERYCVSEWLGQNNFKEAAWLDREQNKTIYYVAQPSTGFSAQSINVHVRVVCVPGPYFSLGSLCADPSKQVMGYSNPYVLPRYMRPTPESQCLDTAVTFTHLQPAYCRYPDFEYCLDVEQTFLTRWWRKLKAILVHPPRMPFQQMKFDDAKNLCNSYGLNLQENYIADLRPPHRYFMKVFGRYFGWWLEEGPWASSWQLPKFFGVEYDGSPKVYIYGNKSSSGIFNVDSTTIAYPVCRITNETSITVQAQRCLREGDQGHIIKPKSGNCLPDYKKRTWKQGGICDIKDFDYCFGHVTTATNNKFSLPDGSFLNGQPFMVKFDEAKLLCTSLPPNVHSSGSPLRNLGYLLGTFPRLPFSQFWFKDGSLYNASAGLTNSKPSPVARGYAACFE